MSRRGEAAVSTAPRVISLWYSRLLGDNRPTHARMVDGRWKTAVLWKLLIAFGLMATCVVVHATGVTTVPRSSPLVCPSAETMGRRL